MAEDGKAGGGRALFDIFTSYWIFMPFTYQLPYGFMPQRLWPMAKVATNRQLHRKTLKLAESLRSGRANACGI